MESVYHITFFINWSPVESPRFSFHLGEGQVSDCPSTLYLQMLYK